MAHEHGAFTGAALLDHLGHVENMNTISTIQANHYLCCDKGHFEEASWFDWPARCKGIPRVRVPAVGRGSKFCAKRPACHGKAVSGSTTPGAARRKISEASRFDSRWRDKHGRFFANRSPARVCRRQSAHAKRDCLSCKTLYRTPYSRTYCAGVASVIQFLHQTINQKDAAERS